MIEEIFEVAVLMFELFFTVGLTLSKKFLDLDQLFVISFKEIIKSLNSWHLKINRQIKHQKLLILDVVKIKHLLKNNFHRLIAVQFHCDSYSCAEVEVSLNDQVLICNFEIQ